MPLPDVGILLVNLGTPAYPDHANVSAYLREFLLDPKVIALPAPLRWLLVNCLIVPLRTAQAVDAYAAIWQEQGSPLLINSLKFCESLADQYQVQLGMRYGAPGISQALAKFVAIKKLIILPLFPQYSEAVTGSVIEHVQQLIAKDYPHLEVLTIRDFYNDPSYIKTLADSVRPYLHDNFDFLLTSYHGLPLRQAGEYAEHCQVTSKLLAKELALAPDKWGLSFQSRLGILPWLKPYTTEILPQLYTRGVRKLVISCPSFVADCLETLEEIGIRAKRQWLDLGGENLVLVPSLNGNAQWIRKKLFSVGSC